MLVLTSGTWLVEGVCVPIVTSTRYSCANQSLTEVTSGLPTSKGTIDLNYNRIARVGDVRFSAGTVISSLFLKGNVITMLSAGTLFGVIYSFVDLSNNVITFIESGAFMYATALQAISLEGNGFIGCLPGTNMFVGTLMAAIQTSDWVHCASTVNATSHLKECVSCNVTSCVNQTAAATAGADSGTTTLLLYIVGPSLFVGGVLVGVCFREKRRVDKSDEEVVPRDGIECVSGTAGQLTVADVGDMEYEAPVQGGSYYDVGVAPEDGCLYQETGLYGHTDDEQNHASMSGDEERGLYGQSGME